MPALKPTIHLNGTPARVLLEERMEAASALRDAIAALCRAAPNGRDYYPQGPGAIDEATMEHRRRLRQLQDVLADLDADMAYLVEFGT